MEKFEEAPEGVDIEVPTGGKDEIASHTFSTGDNVEVCQGELVHLRGKVVAIDGNFITVVPKHEDLKVGKHTQMCIVKISLIFYPYHEIICACI